MPSLTCPLSALPPPASRGGGGGGGGGRFGRVHVGHPVLLGVLSAGVLIGGYFFAKSGRELLAIRRAEKTGLDNLDKLKPTEWTEGYASKIPESESVRTTELNRRQQESRRGPGNTNSDN